MSYTIPDELVSLFQEGRVIPFVGAGMSANVGHPSWDALLKHLGDNLEHRRLTRDGPELTHDDIVGFTNNDRLRIAEYYYLTEGKQIGPLRSALERQFGNVSPLDFGGYVDLVNLGAPRIYTTNFDDLIEKSYRALEVPYERITTPRDLARSTGKQTEIVKYHGDLTNDLSLVLTESQYYHRLNFESPMDLKFRADLLGKSVMFIGYSFSDLNIRIIWFRLLDMMQGVDPAEMPTSYMVIIKPNPVEQALYKDAGIETIVLDPDSSVEESGYSNLLGDFLYDLAIQVCRQDIPGTDEKPFISRTLLRRIVDNSTADRGTLGTQRQIVSRRSRGRDVAPDVGRIGTYRVPDEYTNSVFEVFENVLPVTRDSVNAAIRLHEMRPRDLRVGTFLVHSAIVQTNMNLQGNQRIDWKVIAGMDLPQQLRTTILRRFTSELGFHEGSFDDELFHVALFAMDMSSGRFGASDDEIAEADRLLDRLEERYPGSVEELREQGRGSIEAVALRYRPDQGVGEPDDLPF